MARHSAAGRPARPRRPNRFDRPPEPHDWRWVVGGIGRSLISLGVLLFAFVAYQLWGTGIQTARAQDRLERSFDALLATTSPSPPPTSVSVASSTVPGPVTSDGAMPIDSVPEATTTSTVVLQPAVAPARGEPLARLEIDSIGLTDVIVVEGVRPDDLKTGPGHFPETPLPGQFGNAAIAGHRTTYGEPFLDIDLIPVGADVVLTTPWGTFTYVVENASIVGADDYALVIPTTDPNRATLTLVSCHPKYSAKQRYIVTASIDAERSDPVGFPGATTPPPSPATTVAPTATSITSTSTITSTTEPTGALPATSLPATTTPATSTPATTTPADATTPEAPDDTSSEDVFASQWFSDDEAFVPAALWGFRLMVVAFVATALSRITRRNWVGALVGITPFVVCLYFFFEDLSRLLPANL